MLELVKFGSGFTQIELQMILDRTKNVYWHEKRNGYLYGRHFSIEYGGFLWIRGQ